MHECRVKHTWRGDHFMQWSRNDLATALPDQHSTGAARALIDRRGTKSCPQQAIERGRCASSLHMPEGCRAQ